MLYVKINPKDAETQWNTSYHDICMSGSPSSCITLGSKCISPAKPNKCLHAGKLHKGSTITSSTDTAILYLPCWEHESGKAGDMSQAENMDLAEPETCILAGQRYVLRPPVLCNCRVPKTSLSGAGGPMTYKSHDMMCSNEFLYHWDQF